MAEARCHLAPAEMTITYPESVESSALPLLFGGWVLRKVSRQVSQ